MPLPDVHSLEDYRAIYHEESLWRPAIDAIRQRHGLTAEPCRRGPDGTHLVYFSGPAHVIKLFVPLFPHDFVAECLVARRVDGALGVATPSILHQGEIDGWNYLIMTRVPGRPLGEVWSDIPREDRQAIAWQVGEMIARLRTISVKGVKELVVDWPAFLGGQIATGAERQRGGATPEALVAQIPAYVGATPEGFEEPLAPALLLADITSEHVLVSQQGGVWHVVGYVDFGDAFVGHPDYELVAPGLDIARGDGDILRALLLGAGYSESELDQEFSRRLMTFTLLHRFVKLYDVAHIIPEARRAQGLEELARVLWPL